MKKLTYQEAYNKIIDAYFKDEIDPMDRKFCFCGTLANKRVSWCQKKHYLRFQNIHSYSFEEYKQMEYALLLPLSKFGVGYVEGEGWSGILREYEEGFENELFAGMCAALEVLKQIHKERGEDVDAVPVFEKRKLIPESEYKSKT